MRIHKLARQITLNAALGIGMCLATLPASAQDWPARNVTIGAHDLQIGATAVFLGYQVATRDLRSFPKIKGLDTTRW